MKSPTSKVEIPSALIDLVRNGQVVLVLGAGASFGATAPDGSSAPSGPDLAKLLSEKFLGGEYSDRPLSQIADLAVSESDSATVQEFLEERFVPLDPAPFHCLVPTFRWHGLVTTNYDTILEKAYQNSEQRVQKIACFISDNDRVEDKVRSANHVLLIKLHGCITRISDPRLPLILTPDQYLSHREHRNYLYDMFSQWGKEKTLVFIGQDLHDSDIRQLLMILEERVGAYRPRYFLVRPALGEPERRLWSRRKIDVIDSTFEDFLRALDASIPTHVRPLLTQITPGHPITRHFAENVPMSQTLQEALDSDIEYVHSGISIPPGEPRDFYKGFDFGWYPVTNGLDLRRVLVDTLMLDVILPTESQRPALTDFYLLKGEAGAGKTVLLRRLAWETAVEADVLTLYLRNNREMHWEVIQELAALARQRIFLFIDDAADNVLGLERTLVEAKRLEIPLTVITTESYSLWEIHCSRLNDFITSEFSIRHLSKGEIVDLVNLLEQHESLGVRLGRMTPDQRIEEFLEVSDRQLLVALHEATQGEPLEVIVEREYRDVLPRAAQALYLTVCVLNRLRVPVRAGLISRVHDIPFERFRDKLLGPLDHVVRPHLDSIVKDYMYQARHPQIADMVFRRVLTRPEHRFGEYSRLLKAMNLAFRTDEIAFHGMMKGNSINELFPDYEMAQQLYNLAEKLAPHDGELFHQRAKYELRRPNPSTDKAYAALEKAWALGRTSPSVKHTFSELALVRADETESSLRKEKYWGQAEDLASSLLSHPSSGRYGRHTLVKIGISRLRYSLRQGHTGRVLEELLANVELHLERGYQKNPNDSYLTSSEADLRELLNESDEALNALRSGFAANPRDSYLAIRLAKAHEFREDLNEALHVIDLGLKADRSNKRLNYRKAMILRKQGEADPELLVYYLRRAFTPGDDNYEAQFWCARYLYELADPEKRREAKGIFTLLRKARIPYDTKIAVRDVMGGEDAPRIVRGFVHRLESTYGMIELDGDPDWLFVHSSNIADSAWDSLRIGARVRCQIGFSMRGSTALALEGE